MSSVTRFRCAVMALLACVGCGGLFGTVESLLIEPGIATVLPGGHMTFSVHSFDARLDPADVTWEAVGGGTVSGTGSTVSYTAASAPGDYVLRVTSNTARNQVVKARVHVVVTEHAPPCTDPTATVDVPDLGLRTVILEQFGSPGGHPMCGQLQSLTHLDNAVEREIQDLEGLQHAINLESLDLSYNYVHRLTPLAGLTGLTGVDLSTNRFIADLTPLAGLTALTTLDLRRNQVQDLSGLDGLVSLPELVLSENGPIVDLHPMAGPSSLESLEMASSQLEDLTGLEGLTGLRSLGLDWNPGIVDVTPLSGLTGLKDLSLSSGELQDLSGLEGLTDLEGLHLRGNRIVSVTPLAGLANLARLDLSYNHISDIGALGSLTNLETLHLTDNVVSDISALANLTNLERIGLAHNRIGDIAALAYLTELSWWLIQLNGNLIHDLSPLVANTGLSANGVMEVELSDNCLDLSPGSLASAAVHALEEQGMRVYTHDQKKTCVP